MIQRRRFSKDYKEKLIMEVVSGQSSITQISQRENIHPQTIRNWKASIAQGSFENENETELLLRKRIAELEGALAEVALDNHILKKTEKYLKEMQRKEKLSGVTSPRSSTSSEAAKHSK